MRASIVGCSTNSAAPANRAKGSSVASPMMRHAMKACSAAQP
jgi:hypothetical protein